MRSELIDESRYLSNRMDFIRLLGHIYKDTNLKEVVDKYRLVLVGGQALAFWHYHYFGNDHDLMKPRDFQYSFSDDIDFYGIKFGLEFLSKKLNVDIRSPENFDFSVSLGIFNIPTNTFPDGVMVDVIHSVGGLTDKDIRKGVEILSVSDFDFPIINPLLCLKSRINNYYAVYKADKEKEINRVEISARVCLEFYRDLVGQGWCKEAASYCESILDMAKSRDGCDLFLKNGIDLTDAIDLDHPHTHESFRNIRFPSAMVQISTNREKRSAHLDRFGGHDRSNDKPADLAQNIRQDIKTLTPAELLRMASSPMPAGSFKDSLPAIEVRLKKNQELEP